MQPGHSLQPQPRITRLQRGLRDALLPVLLAVPGGLLLSRLLLPRGTNILLLDYLGHAWFLAIVSLWVVVFRQRFSIGRFTGGSLRGWLLPWIIVGGLNLVLDLQGAGLVVHRDVLAWIVFEGLVVGVAEEWLFRGLIQTTLNRVIGGAGVLGRLRWGTIIAALIFGLSHLGNLTVQPLGETLQQGMFATIIGVILGHYYDRTQNLWGAAILHNVIDVTNVAVPLLLLHH